MRARAMKLMAVALMIIHGNSFGATAADLAAPSADCLSEAKRTAPDDSSVSPRCSSFTASQNTCCSPKVSPETEGVLKIAEGTLQAVRENTDFLATLWKWTTIVVGFVAAVIAAFGIRTFSDLRKVANKYNEDVKRSTRSMIEINTNFARLSKEITSNNIVMQNCLSLQRGVDDIESERIKRSKDAPPDPTFEKRATDTYRGVVKLLSGMLLEHNPQDPAVASFAYDLLGSAQYKIGNVSLAIESVKKSLEFKGENPTALYNAASYTASIHLVDQSVEFLQRAIEKNQDFLISAKTDSDFDAIRASTRFIGLVG